MAIAKGQFDVRLSPQVDEERFASGRMTIDKTFSGDLTATSQGQMLSWLNGAKDSGGYVALERVQGTLAGRSGSFVLQHSSTMRTGSQQQQIFVVPGSGDGELTGLAGSMTIDIRDGVHSYTFDYTIDA